MGILQIIRGTSSKSAAELRTDLATLSVAGAERAVDELEAKRRQALLDASDEEIERIESELTVANRNVERTVAAITELTERISAAEDRERREDVETKIAEAIECRRTAIAALIEMDKHAFALAKALGTFEANENIIQRANEFARQQGRIELKVKSAGSSFAELFDGRPPHQPNTFRLPGYRDDQWGVPPMAQTTFIENRWLARAKEIN